MADMNLANPGSIEQTLLSTIPTHTYTIPESLRRFPGDPAVVVLRELTFAEDLQAQDAAATRKRPYPYEALMRSIVQADGSAIDWKDDGKERFFSGLSTGVRNSLLVAFNKFANPSDKELEDFLASEKTTVG
jgi:hypothetical protein